MTASLPGRLVQTPPPREYPTYQSPPKKVGELHSWSIVELLDGVFFVAGAVFVLWFVWLLAVHGLRFSSTGLVVVVVFWLLLAYIGLPRLQEMLSRIYVPDYFIGRTVTGIGVLGDPVNVALIGSEEQIHEAMAKAGWTRADEVTLKSSWGIVVSSVLRRSYPEAPVSSLLIFDRQQAFAYQQEVDGNASQRHHVRFWPTPEGWVLPGGGGRVDWLAAGTYDRAVGLSLFTLQVTHKIDADVDIERDYIVGSVRYANPDSALRVIEDFSTAFRSRNGGGDVVRTDGNLPILDVGTLSGAAKAEVADVGQVERLARHHLPGPAIMLAGAFVVAKALFALWGVAVVALGMRSLEVSATQLVLTAVSAVLVVALWILVLMRRAWARTALMLLASITTAVQLAELGSEEGRGDWLSFVSAGLSLLVLIAISSGEARRWVRQ